MHIERLDIDSLVFGRDVLAIHDFDPAADLDAFERDYRARFAPAYVSCKAPLENIAAVHRLEAQGFNLIECQIRSAIKLRKPYDTASFPYTFEPVTREEDLGPVLDIAAATFVHDRFSIDPLLGADLSGRRFREYVRKSFRAPDETVWRLLDRAGRTVAFKTHRRVGDAEVLFLLGGVHPEFKNLGLGPINEYFEFNALIAQGVRRGVTHISAANTPVFNLEIGSLGFRVQTVFAVMRKVYPA